MKTYKITITEDESKICKLDGIRFASSRLVTKHVKQKYGLTFEDYIVKSYYNGIKPTCLKTGVPLTFKAHKIGPWFSDYAKNCFPRQAHTKETKQKIKLGCEVKSMELYGVKNPFQSQEVKAKIKSTNIEKYGVENPMKLEKFKRYEPRTVESLKKARETNIEKYGDITFSSSPAGKLQIKSSLFKYNFNTWGAYQSHLKNLHVSVLTSEKDFCVGKLNKFKCLLDGAEWDSIENTPYCPVCSATHQDCRSNFEKEFCLFLDSIGATYRKNKRFESKYELDIWFEDRNLGIELNGLFWHSELNGKGRLYHIDKLNFFNERGIRIVQIIEDEWYLKRKIVENKIKSILKLRPIGAKVIHARKCEIKRVEPSQIESFIESEHIQGNARAKHYYAAFFNGDIIAAMTFSFGREALGGHVEDSVYELVRFCTKSDCTISGIFGRLLAHFIKSHNPTKVISYADRRFTDKKSNIYEKNGFTLKSISLPGYWYIKGHKRFHRFGFQKNKLVKMGHDKNLSEWEIMKQLKYNRIWDCGQFKYQLIIGS